MPNGRAARVGTTTRAARRRSTSAFAPAATSHDDPRGVRSSDNVKVSERPGRGGVILTSAVSRRLQGGDIMHKDDHNGQGPYAGLRDRDYFHIMLNLDSYQDFLPTAWSLANHFLDEARRMQADPRLEPELRPFRYT